MRCDSPPAVHAVFFVTIDDVSDLESSQERILRLKTPVYIV